jgi:adenosylhomocysteine nucleosidase
LRVAADFVMKIAVVVGMDSEKPIVGERPGIQVIVGAGNALALASRLEATVAAGADGILSIGVCGALAPQLQVGEIVVGVSVCDSGDTIIHCDDAWTTRIFRALTNGPQPVCCPVSFANVAWSASPTATVAERAALRAATSADVVDMESWIAANAAKAHGLPFAIMRVVLDSSTFELPPAALLPFTPSGGNDIEAILGSVARDPWQIPALLKLASWSEKAMGNLAIALSRIGEDFRAAY